MTLRVTCLPNSKLWPFCYCWRYPRRKCTQSPKKPKAKKVPQKKARAPVTDFKVQRTFTVLPHVLYDVYWLVWSLIKQCTCTSILFFILTESESRSQEEIKQDNQRGHRTEGRCCRWRWWTDWRHDHHWLLLPALRIHRLSTRRSREVLQYLSWLALVMSIDLMFTFWTLK